MQVKINKNGWAEYVTYMEKRTGAYRVLVGNLEAKRPLGSPRHRW
jgi:hypothetical protein